MNIFHTLRAAVVMAVVTAFLPGCAILKSGRPTSRVMQAKEQHEAFRAQPGWRKQTYRNEEILKQAAADNTAVEISIREQRGLLLVQGAIAMDFPVATGRPAHPTPKGSYKILSKEKNYSSNLYGRIEAADGTVVNADADTRTDAIPEGGRFVGSSMPYWMRIDTSGIGMHVGRVPGHRTASHGCIRLERGTATQLFAMLPRGTPVIVDSFAPTLGGPVGLKSIVVGDFPDKVARPSRPAAKPASAPASAPTPTPAPMPEVSPPPAASPPEEIPAPVPKIQDAPSP